MPDPPYAPSTWNHQPRSEAIAPTPARSSMIPAFVVPDVQTTAAMFSASSATAARTVVGGQPVSRRVDHEGVHLEQFQRVDDRRVRITADHDAQSAGRPPGALAVSRATARADRLPADPPETKHPPDVVGSPASWAITRSTLFSAAIAPDASSQEMPWIEAQDTSMSNSRLAFVGAAGMNPRNRGLSAEITLGATTEVYTPSTSPGAVACRGSRRRGVVQLVGRQRALVEGHRIHPQPILGVRENAAHHPLGVLVDLVHGLSLHRRRFG